MDNHIKQKFLISDISLEINLKDKFSALYSHSPLNQWYKEEKKLKSNY